MSDEMTDFYPCPEGRERCAVDGVECECEQREEERLRSERTNDMWRVDVAGYPISVKGQAAREHLEQVNRSLAQMKLALHQIAAVATKPGGAGQIARDALRVCK